MSTLRCRRYLAFVSLVLFLLGFPCIFPARSQETVSVAEITPTVLVFSTTAGNVIASLGPDGALLVGIPSAASTPFIARALATRTKSPVRYVVIAPSNPVLSEGDAGWGRLGAFVAMHENALQRIGGNVMGALQPLSARFIELGVDRPRVAFSEVLAFDLNGESIHVVHKKPGYSNADALVHFHVAKLIYLGEVFPGDGYPAIDSSQGGTLAGLLDTIEGWTDPSFHIVPARGAVTNGPALKEFRDMIVTVRDRVQHLLSQGRTESQVLAQHPTTDLDARWGHGRVPPDLFVSEIYRALKAQ